VSLREQWKSVARADRFVYGAALVLVGLSFLVHVRAIAEYFRDQPDPFPDYFSNGNHFDSAQSLIIGSAVLMLLGWEVAKLGYKTLSESGPVIVGVLVAVPVAAPLTALAAWLAKLFAANIPEHPLFTQVLPLPIGVGITVYLMTTALVIAGLREFRHSSQQDAE
jgi:hypothetical protein